MSDGGTQVAVQRVAPGMYSASHTLPLDGAVDARVSAHDETAALVFSRDGTTWFAAFAAPE